MPLSGPVSRPPFTARQVGKRSWDLGGQEELTSEPGSDFRLYDGSIKLKARYQLKVVSQRVRFQVGHCSCSQAWGFFNLMSPSQLFFAKLHCCTSNLQDRCLKKQGQFKISSFFHSFSKEDLAKEGVDRTQNHIPSSISLPRRHSASTAPQRCVIHTS